MVGCEKTTTFEHHIVGCEKTTTFEHHIVGCEKKTFEHHIVPPSVSHRLVFISIQLSTYKEFQKSKNILIYFLLKLVLQICRFVWHSRHESDKIVLKCAYFYLKGVVQ